MAPESCAVAALKAAFFCVSLYFLAAWLAFRK